MPEQDDAGVSGLDRQPFRWRVLLPTAVTAVVIWLLIRHVAGGVGFADVFRDARWELAAIPVALACSNMFLAAVRLQIVVRALDVRLPIRRAVSVVLQTFPLVLVAPSRAGDLLRAVAIRDLVPVVEGMSAVVAEKLVDVQSLCLLSIVGCAIGGLWEWGLVAAGLLALEWTVVGALLWKRGKLLRIPLLRRAEKILRRSTAALAAFRARPGIYLWLSAVSLLSWTVTLAIVWVLAQIFWADVTAREVIAFWPLSVFVGLLPVTLAGMGTRDAAFAYLVSAAATGAVDKAPILATTFSFAVVGIWFPAVVGLPSMVRAIRHRFEPKASL